MKVKNSQPLSRSEVEASGIFSTVQKILLVGFGSMGAMHADVYRLLPDAQIVGVVDPQGEAIRQKLSSHGVVDLPVFLDFASAVGSLEFSVVDICLPTDLHCEVALQAFEKRKHVFCEKPIALKREDALAMVRAARSKDLQFMVGHCILFWPEYLELKRLVESGEHGRLVSLSMDRRSSRPNSSVQNWVNQPERCLGAALDLHIHDTDFLLSLLGQPKTVTSQGIRDETGWSSISTQYEYELLSVTAHGAWNYPKKWGFQMRFQAVFERAALDYDSRAEPTLILTAGDSAPSAVVLPLPTGKTQADVEKISKLGGYYHELAYFLRCLGRGEPVTISTGEQASASLDLVLAEIDSATLGKRISLL